MAADEAVRGCKRLSGHTGGRLNSWRAVPSMLGCHPLLTYILLFPSHLYQRFIDFMQGLLDSWFAADRERQTRLARTRRIRIDDRTPTPSPSPKLNVDEGIVQLEPVLVPVPAFPLSTTALAPPSPPYPLVFSSSPSTVSSDSGSNDSDDPVSRKARKYLDRKTAIRLRAAKRSCAATFEEHENGVPVVSATACPPITATVAPPPPPSQSPSPPPSPPIINSTSTIETSSDSSITIETSSDSSDRDSSDFQKDPLLHFHANGGPVDLLNLWKAVPSFNNKFVTLHSKHPSDPESEISPGLCFSLCVCVCFCLSV
jgi:hypothetical protein